MTPEDPWSWTETAEAYVRFCRRHDRYRHVGHSLAARVSLRPGARVAEVGAGTGVTTREILACMPPDAHLAAVEPSAAMAAEATLNDPRRTLHAELPDGPFDAIFCSAAVWLLGDLQERIAWLANHLSDDGVLCFSVPSAFVGLPDGDPADRPKALNALVTAFVAPRTEAPPAGPAPPHHAALTAQLAELGWRADHTETRVLWTFDTQRDFLSLPPVGLSMRPDLSLADLPDAVATAAATVSLREGWRTERWSLWTVRR